MTQTKNFQHTIVPGLLDGLAGEISISLELHLAGKTNIDSVLAQVDNLIALLNFHSSSDQRYFHCSGYSGIGCLVHDVNQLGRYEELDALLNTIDQILHDVMVYYRNNSDLNLDPLHGLTGVLVYMSRRLNHSKWTKEFIADIIKICRHSLISVDKDHGFLLNVYEKSEKRGINFSLSHGLAGMLFNFLLIEDKYPGVFKVSELTRPILNFICRQIDEFEGKLTNACLPHIIYDNTYSTDTRLAWCYGDLGVASSLLYAGKVLSDARYWTYGEKVAVKALAREQICSTTKEITGFCHGYPGVAFMFYRIGHYTGDKRYIDRADYWFTYWKSQYQSLGPSQLFEEVPEELHKSILAGEAGLQVAELSRHKLNSALPEYLFVV